MNTKHHLPSQESIPKSFPTKNTLTKKPHKPFLAEGVQFECQGSGKCCTSHGEFGFVFLTLEDRRKIARNLKLTTSAFTKKYCTSKNGFWHLIEDPKNPDCMFLKKKRCQIYEARPTQCRTWPFWPELMNPKSWAKEVVAFCPGVGKGKTVGFDKIQSQMKEQKQSEEAMKSEALGL
ncbi:MAG: YkgJ family cysteine cluster protein [Deltaproteobacteria bacterium]|jgi:Fe-S-cluster containining protein|nr:YkgJ family cysteine cluster protein [Deltaproteobacteria bacterium]